MTDPQKNEAAEVVEVVEPEVVEAEVVEAEVVEAEVVEAEVVEAEVVEAEVVEAEVVEAVEAEVVEAEVVEAVEAEVVEAEIVEVVDAEAAEAAPDPMEELRVEAETVRKQQRETHERMLRLAADYENFKRRTEREKEDIRKYGSERIILDMIPILDNLDRALSHQSKEAEGVAGLVEGVEMVQRQFRQALAKHGVTSFDSLGEPFDPQRHEAVQQIDSEDHESNTVVTEYQKGYFLNERLVRPAMVVVTK